MTRLDRTPGCIAAETGAGTVRVCRAVNPSDEEILRLSKNLRVNKAIFHAALAEGEKGPCAEKDGNAVRLAFEAPFTYRQGDSMRFEVFPLSLILGQGAAALVGGEASPVADEWVKGAGSSRPVPALLQLLAGHFSRHLRQMEKMMTYLEKQPAGMSRSRKLRELMELQTALVHYTASLRGDEALTEKVLSGGILPIGEEERPLYEHAEAEFRRMSNLAEAYARLLEGTIGALSSMVSNSLNATLRVFAGLTVVMAFLLGGLSLYAMQAPGLSPVWFLVPLAAICMGCGFFALYQARGRRPVERKGKTDEIG